MALKDKLAGFIDNLGLKETFETKPRDPLKARRPVLRGIQLAGDQFAEGKTRVPNRWWTAANNVVAFSPTLNGTPLLINAQTTNYIPAERFPEFLSSFKEAVDAGEFDDEIEQIEAGDGNAGGNARVRMPAKRTGGGARTFSDESRLNIRVGGFRRGGQSDDAIRARLEGEGVGKDAIDKALARKKA